MEWISEIRRLPTRSSWELLERLRGQVIADLWDRALRDGVSTSEDVRVTLFTDCAAQTIYLEARARIVDEIQEEPAPAKASFEAEDDGWKVGARGDRYYDADGHKIHESSVADSPHLWIDGQHVSLKGASAMYLGMPPGRFRDALDKAIRTHYQVGKTPEELGEEASQAIQDAQMRALELDSARKQREVAKKLVKEQIDSMVDQSLGRAQEPHAPRRGIQIWSSTPLSDEEVLGAAEQMDRAGANVWDEGDADDARSEMNLDKDRIETIQRNIQAQRENVKDLTRDLVSAEKDLYDLLVALKAVQKRNSQDQELEEG